MVWSRLADHPEVVEACAFGIEDSVNEQTVAVAVQLKTETRITEKQLTEWVEKRIRSEAVPSRIFLVSGIPKTDRGKLNRDNVAQFCLQEASVQ